MSEWASIVFGIEMLVTVVLLILTATTVWKMSKYL
jgi:hypothetical protein